MMITIGLTGIFNPINSMIDFVVVAGGGLAVGFILAILISQAIRFIDDSLIETTLTTVLAFGSYLVAEQVHVSGVLAVVAAGLVNGNIGPRGMSPSTKILVYSFWDYAAFIANSVVFLLIGIQIDLSIIFSEWQVILWAILAVLVARAVSVYGLSWIGKSMPSRYKPVLFWGGLRGAISLALALSLPASLGSFRVEIQAMAFGVVLFTLLVQGLTMKPLINRMNLIQRNEYQEEYERRHARSVMARAAYERLEHMYQNGLISTDLWEKMSIPIKRHADALTKAVREVLNTDPSVEEEVFNTAMREMLISQRSVLNSLLREDIISEDIYSQLASEVDTTLTSSNSNQLQILLNRPEQPIRGLMSIIIQDQDVESVIAILNRMGVSFTRLSSSGGFLGTKNTTLLVGIPEGEESQIINVISKVSHQRIGYLPDSEKTPERSTSVIVGGATIFTLDVERYEEI
jgi:CPA1 family monovalent cation:H+ antiporter